MLLSRGCCTACLFVAGVKLRMAAVIKIAAISSYTWPAACTWHCCTLKYPRWRERLRTPPRVLKGAQSRYISPERCSFVCLSRQVPYWHVAPGTLCHFPVSLLAQS